MNARIKKKKFKIEILKMKPDDVFVAYYKDSVDAEEIKEVIDILYKWSNGKAVVALPQDIRLDAESRTEIKRRLENV